MISVAPIACVAAGCGASTPTTAPDSGNGAAQSAPAIGDLGPTSPLAQQMLGIHVHRLIDAPNATPWPRGVQFGALRVHDVHGAFWFDLEPQPGQFDFQRLDRLVDTARAHGVELLLTLGQTPHWASARPDDPGGYVRPGSPAEPARMSDWDTYVRTVATRYKGRIAAYEVWNEPNLPDFYTGDVPTMVQMAKRAYQIIKSVDPSAAVVSPSATNADGVAWLDRFLAAGGGDAADVIGFHLYGANPETDVLPVAQQVKGVLAHRGVSKPLWNTEVGWCTLPPRTAGVKVGSYFCDAPGRTTTDNAAAPYVIRTTLLAFGLGFARTYWYAWDNKFMGLVRSDNVTPNETGAAFGTLGDWTRGRRVRSCTGTAPFVCELASSDGRTVHVAWVPAGSAPFSAPAAWKATAVRGMDGGRASLAASGMLTLTTRPVLIE